MGNIRQEKHSIVIPERPVTMPDRDSLYFIVEGMFLALHRSAIDGGSIRDFYQSAVAERERMLQQFTADDDSPVPAAMQSALDLGEHMAELVPTVVAALGHDWEDYTPPQIRGRQTLGQAVGEKIDLVMAAAEGSALDALVPFDFTDIAEWAGYQVPEQAGDSDLDEAVREVAAQNGASTANQVASGLEALAAAGGQVMDLAGVFAAGA